MVVRGKNDPLPNSEEASKNGRGGLNMVIYKAPTMHSDIDDLVLEAVTSNGAILEHSVDYWCEYMYKMGQIPSYILAGDKDRFYKYIFASIMVRRHANSDQKVRAFRNVVDEEKKVGAKDDYDSSKHQQGLDKRVWGMNDGDE